MKPIGNSALPPEFVPPLTTISSRAASWSSIREYLEVTLVLSVVTALGWFLVPATSHSAIGLLYLLAVIILSLRVDRWPVLFAALLSAFAWDFLLIPPRFSLAILNAEDAMMLGTYCIVALVAGHLTSRIRIQEREERAREVKATALYHLTRAFAAARDRVQVVATSVAQASAIFGDRATVLLCETDAQTLVPQSKDIEPFSAQEWVAINAAQAEGRAAGWSTDLASTSRCRAQPIARGDRFFGVLAFRTPTDDPPSPFLLNLLDAFAAQLAILLEREQLREASEREKVYAESARLHRSLLDGVAHELKTPLAVLSAATTKLARTDAGNRDELMNEVQSATERLNRLVFNLLNQSLLDSRALRPPLDWCDIRELLGGASRELATMMVDHPLTVNIPKEMPLFRANAVLLSQAIVNLLHNGARHTPSGTPLYFSAKCDLAKAIVEITIADRGHGLPASIRENPFQKFRGKTPGKGVGLGLGLSIVNGFVQAQGGQILADENPGGGARFIITLPYEAHGPVPDE